MARTAWLGLPQNRLCMGGPSVKAEGRLSAASAQGQVPLPCSALSLLPHFRVEAEGPGPEVEIPVAAEKRGLQGGRAWIWG